MRNILITTTLAALVVAPSPALAQSYSGWAVRTTTMRAGPDYDYPPVQRIGRNANVAIFGCLNDWSWCDVGYRYDRGWVAGRDLVADYRGRRQGISSYLGIGILSFVFGNYWDRHYRGRSFYNQRSRWEQHYYTNYQPHWGPRPNVPQVYRNRNPANVPMQRQRGTASPQVERMPVRNRSTPAFNRNRSNTVTRPQSNAQPRTATPPVIRNRTQDNRNVQRPQRGTTAPQAQPGPDRNRKVRDVTANPRSQASTRPNAAPQVPARQRGNPDNKGNKGNKKDRQVDQPKPR